MEIPDKVKIGGIEYEIVQLKPRDGKLVKVRNWGEINFLECKIYLNKEIDNQRKWKILFHEVLHVIEEDNELDSVESYIQTISCSIYAFLKDNKLNFE